MYSYRRIRERVAVFEDSLLDKQQLFSACCFPHDDDDDDDDDDEPRPRKKQQCRASPPLVAARYCLLQLGDWQATLASSSLISGRS